MTFIIDGAPVRTVKAVDAKGKFPQTPMRLKLGIWAGGDSSRSKDQQLWAGGAIDGNKGPYAAVIDSVKIENYNPAEQYRYKDNSGTWQSIEIIGAKPGGKNKDTPSGPVPNQGLTNSVSKPDAAANSSSSSVSATSTTSATPTSTLVPPRFGNAQESTTKPNTTTAAAKPTATNAASSNPLAITPLLAFCLVAMHFVF
jgi:hypothetical protein